MRLTKTATNAKLLDIGPNYIYSGSSPDALATFNILNNKFYERI